MKKPLLVSSSLLAGLLVCLAAAPASAQDSTSPPPAATTTSPPPASSSSMGGGAIGIGAVEWLSGVTGAQFVYDMPVFHIEANLGYDHISHADNTADSLFQIGVAGWYHLAKGNMADFSIGGGAALVYNSPRGAGTSSTGFALEPGAEARVFLSPNFALSARTGVAITFGDNNLDTTFSIGGQVVTGFGFTYFFR
jgi:hypothetical protein